MAELDVRKLKKIEGSIYELHKINKDDLQKHKEDCKNHILRLSQGIEELEHKKGVYEKEIIIVNELLEK